VNCEASKENCDFQYSADRHMALFGAGLCGRLWRRRWLRPRQDVHWTCDKLLTLWKQETPWLSETPAHALQQALVDLDKAYQNFFKKRAQFPKFKKKGQRTSFRESDPKTITFDQLNSRMRLPKIGWVRYHRAVRLSDRFVVSPSRTWLASGS
jgi:transposase